MSDFQTIIQEGISPDHTLTSLYDIENVLLLVDRINKKVDYYKGLKQYRVKSIDEQIVKLNEKVLALRSIVLNTMKVVAPNDKTLNFPSIGKVSRRKAPSVISVDDQDAVIRFLESQGEKDEVIKPSVPVVDKRKLKIVIARHQQVGESIPGISITTGEESLSISFEKKDDSAPKAVPAEIVAIDLDALDALAV